MLYVTDVWAAYFKQNIHRNIKISNTQFRTKYTFSTYQLLSHNSRPKLFCLGYSFHPKDACTDRLKSVCVQTARNRAETRDILTVPLYHGIRALITQPVFNPQTSKLGRGAIKKPFRVGHPRRPLPLLRDSPQWLQIPWIEGVRVRCPTNDRFDDRDFARRARTLRAIRSTRQLEWFIISRVTVKDLNGSGSCVVVCRIFGAGCTSLR